MATCENGHDDNPDAGDDMPERALPAFPAEDASGITPDFTFDAAESLVVTAFELAMIDPSR